MLSLHKSALKGFQWTTISTISVTILQFTTIAILARLLLPEAFGLMTILSVIVGFSQVFMDMGMSQAIIHRQNVTHSQLSSLYWLNVAAGGAVTVIVYFAAPLIAAFYDHPEIAGMIQTLSIVFIVISLGNQYRVLCQKELQFGRMAAAEIGAAICFFSIAVISALSGLGVYSLIYGLMAQVCVSSLIFLVIGLRHHHRPSLQYKHFELKGFFSFGFYQMGERSMNYLNANADNLLIGKFLTMDMLGYYSLAWQLCIFPVTKINPILSKVAFPVFSKLQEDKVQMDAFYTVFVRGVSLIIIPAMVFMFFFAFPITDLVYGNGWEMTAMLIPILAWVGIVKAIGSPGGALFLALGRADIGFWWNVLWLFALTGALTAILVYAPDIRNVAYGVLGLSLLFTCAWHLLIHKMTSMTYRPIIKSSIRISLMSMIAGAFAYFVCQNAGLDLSLTQLLLAGIICLSVYIPYLFLFERDLVKFWQSANKG